MISSTSTFTYKGRTVDLSEVGQELGVRYVLEGSIQAAGEPPALFTQLVEADSGHTIWQERFDGTAADIFDLQDEVAGPRGRRARSRGCNMPRCCARRRKPTENLAAYDLCLRATPLIQKLHVPEALTRRAGNPAARAGAGPGLYPCPCAGLLRAHLGLRHALVDVSTGTGGHCPTRAVFWTAAPTMRSLWLMPVTTWPISGAALSGRG